MTGSERRLFYGDDAPLMNSQRIMRNAPLMAGFVFWSDRTVRSIAPVCLVAVLHIGATVTVVQATGELVLEVVAGALLTETGRTVTDDHDSGSSVCHSSSATIRDRVAKLVRDSS